MGDLAVHIMSSSGVDVLRFLKICSTLHYCTNGNVSNINNYLQSYFTVPADFRLTALSHQFAYSCAIIKCIYFLSYFFVNVIIDILHRITLN